MHTVCLAGRYRCGFIDDKREVELPPRIISHLKTIKDEAHGAKARPWDVIAWRDDSQAILFTECKESGKDKITETQRGWLKAGLRAGLSLDSFLVVEWSAEPVGPIGPGGRAWTTIWDRPGKRVLLLADRDHTLCFECHRGEVNRARARRLTEFATPQHVRMTPGRFGTATSRVLSDQQVAHRQQMLDHLRHPSAAAS